jgi:hypothetical protein
MTPPKKAQQWEYKVVSGSCSLHELGEQGWELVSVAETHGAYGKTYYYFKRPITITKEKIPQTRMEEMMQDAGDMLEEMKWIPEFAITISVEVSPRDKKRRKEAEKLQDNLHYAIIDAFSEPRRDLFRSLKASCIVFQRKHIPKKCNAKATRTRLHSQKVKSPTDSSKPLPA